MEYKENDEEIVYLVRENDEDAKNYLVSKYKYIIDIILTKYKRAAYILKIDQKDLYQEAMLGFIDGINKYDSDKDASLKTFISLCVERRIQNFIRKANTKKNQIFNDSLSLDNKISDDSESFINLLSDDNKNDPLNTLETKERYNELKEQIEKILSDFEKEVYKLMVSGFNYIDIARLLNKEPKQIDNTIQRIRNKIKKIID